MLRLNRLHARAQQRIFKFIEEDPQLFFADQQRRQQTQYAAATAAALEDQARFEAFFLQQGGQIAIGRLTTHVILRFVRFNNLDTDH